MAKRYALRLTKSAEKELYQLQPKQFKQVAQNLLSTGKSSSSRL
jgi:mRNA interferase RelE/StbE